MTDELADALYTYGVMHDGWEWEDIAKAAREFIAKEIELASPTGITDRGYQVAHQAGRELAARIARGPV
jgi:hypothetical protein